MPSSGGNETVPSGEVEAREMRAAPDDTAADPAFSVTAACLLEDFHVWFGDSKIVGKDGKPMVVYHGTRPGIEIDEFKARHETDGVYFTPDPDYAEAFTKGMFKDEGNNGAIYPVYLNIRNPYIVEAVYGTKEWDSFVDRGLNRLDLKKQGFDGAILREPNGIVDQIIAFEPEQVSSAIEARASSRAPPSSASHVFDTE